MVNATRRLLEVFHLGEQGVPPGGTARSTWGNVNHGFPMDKPWGIGIHGADIDCAPVGACRCRSRKWGPLGFPRVRGTARRVRPWAS